MLDILLSTYNGARYLEDFMISLANQTMQHFRLVWRDDGSSDHSGELMVSLCQKYHIRSCHVDHVPGNIGVTASYSLLLKHSENPVCFADQDDVWYANKLQVLAEHLRIMEDRYGAETPILFHSDLEVCDRSLNTICDSFWHYQNIKPEWNRFHQLLIQNSVTACASILNQKLVELCINMPDEAICHDWYAALLASATGVIGYTPERLIKYRQHGNNAVAAHNYDLRGIFALWTSGRKALQHRVDHTRKQALALLAHRQDRLPDELAALASGWGNSAVWSYGKKLRYVHHHALRKNTFIRTLGFWWAL